jgi:RNA polymerase sigma-70 factor (ECF subfamily)
MNVNHLSNEGLKQLLPKIRILLRRFCQTIDHDDLLQDVAVKLLKSSSVPNPIHNAWLAKAVRNAVIDAQRKAKLENSYLDRSVTIDMTGSCCESLDRTFYNSNSATPESNLEPDLIARISDVIENLRQPLRQPLVLFLQGYSYSQIAEFMNIKIGTVRSRIHHARRLAQGQLANYR